MDILPYVTGVGGLVAGALPSFVTLWANHDKAKVDVGEQITAGFNALTTSLQKERADLIARIEKQDIKIEQQQIRITHLESYINILQSHTGDLETLMLNAGMKVPVLKMEYKP